MIRPIGLSLLLSLTGMALAGYIPGVNGIILGMLFGMALANLIRIPDSWSKGLSIVSGKGLEWAIVFIAFGIDYRRLADSQFGGSNVLILVIAVIVFVLLLTGLFNQLWPENRSLNWQIGFGTAICGSSAIAALAGTLDGDEEDTAVSIAVVNLIGTIGMLILPLYLGWLNAGDRLNALFIGAGLHSIGNVGGAAYALGQSTGELAIAVKMARVAMLTPALIALNLLFNRKKNLPLRQLFRLPWYLMAFLGISATVSLVDLPQVVLTVGSDASKFLLTLAMTAIGLRINLATLLKKARKGIGFGLGIFALLLGFLAILLGVL